MRLTSRILFVTLFVILASGPAMAEGGKIARVIYWKIKPGTEAQFEAGIKAHNSLHAKNNDPVGIFTGLIVSGHHQGEYARGSLGHSWADFDANSGGMADEDAADMAIHVDPYIESARTVFYEHLPELSRPMGKPAPMARIIYFHLKPGQGRTFRAAVEKIHAALQEQQEWSPYDWYSVVDGGRRPTMVVVMPKDEWAGFERDPRFEGIMQAKYGNEVPGIWESLFSAVESEYSHTMVFPGELAYMPSSGYEVVWNVPLTTESDEARAHFMKGVEAGDLGRGPESREHFLAAVAADPTFASGYLAAAFSANSFSEFVSNLSKAVEHAKGASEIEQAWILSAQKNFENDEKGALAEAERAAVLAPDSPRSRLLVAGAQAALGNYEAERETAWKVTEDLPGHIPAYLQLANSYLFNEPRDFVKAEECARKIVELAPEEQNSHDILGDVHRAQGDLEAALGDYTRAAELAPDNGSPLQQRGHVNSFLGNWEAAREDYDRAMELSEPQVAAIFGVWRALVAVHEGKPEEAVAEFEERIAGIDGMGLSDPLSPKINYLTNIIAIASHHGMHDQAAQAIGRSKELRMQRLKQTGAEENRSNEEAAVAFAEGMLAARQGDYDAARAKAQQYMDIRSADADPQKNQQAHEIMGLAALLEGNHADAIEHYQQASPNNPYAKYHLALAYEAAGDSKRASELFADLAAYNFNAVGYALIRADVLQRTRS